MFIATRDRAYEKVLGNIEEVRARSPTGSSPLRPKETRHSLQGRPRDSYPQTIPCLTPILSVIPCSFSRIIAVLRGCDVGSAGNLAKSVTVEYSSGPVFFRIELHEPRSRRHAARPRRRSALQPGILANGFLFTAGQIALIPGDKRFSKWVWPSRRRVLEI